MLSFKKPFFFMSNDGKDRTNEDIETSKVVAETSKKEQASAGTNPPGNGTTGSSNSKGGATHVSRQKRCRDKSSPKSFKRNKSVLGSGEMDDQMVSRLKSVSLLRSGTNAPCASSSSYKSHRKASDVGETVKITTKINSMENGAAAAATGTKKRSVVKEQSNSHENANGQENEDRLLDRHNKAWTKFAATTAGKDAPNLQEFVAAKQIRLRRREEFEQAVHDCVLALQELSIAMVAETSKPICRRRKDWLSEIEQDIVETLVVNCSRRQSCLTRMEESDRQWRKTFATVTGNVSSGASYQDKGATIEDGISLPKTKMSNMDIHATGGGKKPANQENKAPSSGKGKGSLEKAPAGKRNADKTDWNAICAFQPARRSVVPLLKATVQLHAGAVMIDAVQTEIEKDAVAKVMVLIDNINNTADRMEARFAKVENEIEKNIMTNYKRRMNYQKRVEASAKRAQSVFSGLLSGLFHSLG
ncbi:hypothetical protein IV203_030645 [Nitzschia inconspicua]|uniref:Uncharacterized protein n=1 Tax=Nitzschia inconspicua TaxID=303405 RepID=A0A9K3Q1F0_9STRA|nr:hypothetical protein IV203_030645 [Nitzschia inconspicua]